jgi:hypothetical protein
MGFFNSEHPLGLPKGSVRATIVLVLVLSVVVATQRPLEVPADMWDLLKLAFAFYFATRAANVANGRP